MVNVENSDGHTSGPSNEDEDTDYTNDYEHGPPYEEEKEMTPPAGPLLDLQAIVNSFNAHAHFITQQLSIFDQTQDVRTRTRSSPTGAVSASVAFIGQSAADETCRDAAECLSAALTSIPFPHHVELTACRNYILPSIARVLQSPLSPLFCVHIVLGSTRCLPFRM